MKSVLEIAHERLSALGNAIDIQLKIRALHPHWKRVRSSRNSANVVTRRTAI